MNEGYKLTANGIECITKATTNTMKTMYTLLIQIKRTDIVSTMSSSRVSDICPWGAVICHCHDGLVLSSRLSPIKIVNIMSNLVEKEKKTYIAFDGGGSRSSSLSLPSLHIV